jgi:hypothetical protein
MLARFLSFVASSAESLRAPLFKIAAPISSKPR